MLVERVSKEVAGNEDQIGVQVGLREGRGMVLLFACVILGHQLVLGLRRRQLDPFDLTTLVDAVLLAMWVYAPLSDDSLKTVLERDYRFASITLLGILSLYAGMHFPRLTTVSERHFYDLSSAVVYTERYLRVGLALFVLATLAFTWRELRYRDLSLVEYLVGDRISLYAEQLNRGQSGSVAGAIISFTRPVVLLWLGIEVMKRRWTRAIVLYSVLLCGIVAVAMTRLQVILTLLLPLYWMARLVKKRSWITVLSVVAVALAASVFLLYALHILRTAGVGGISSGVMSVKAVVESLSLSWSAMRGYYLLWTERGELPLEYGLTYVYVLVTLVPRVWWVSKPMTAHESRWTSYIFGEHFATSDEGWGVWTFTAWGEGLTQFGSAGVVLNLFLYGLALGWAQRVFGGKRVCSLVWFYHSVLAAVYLRNSLSMLLWTFLTLLPTLWVYRLSLDRAPRRAARSVGVKLEAEVQRAS